MPNEGVETVNFTLTRIHGYTNGQMTEDTTPILDPNVKEFQSLIKQLSGESGLDKLIKDTRTETSFRYRRYSEVSEFLRGLTLNFPEITSLQRYSSLSLFQSIQTDHEGLQTQTFSGELLLTQVCHAFPSEKAGKMNKSMSQFI